MKTSKTETNYVIPGIGHIGPDSGMKALDRCGDGVTRPGREGVTAVLATGDGKVEFILYEDRAVAFVKSAMGYPAYYPVLPLEIEQPVEAVLMDLDGTTVRSEEFWIWIIEQSTASLLGDPDFRLEEADLPYVSGHSVSEHLKHCIHKYCPDKTVEEARGYYFEHTHRELEAIVNGGGRQGAFTPSPGIKEFLLELKARNVKLGLVTSGLYEKAWPEILSAFRTMDLGDPKDFYDAIITAGFPLRKGEPGTLGELSPKPHPWLYAEVARVGLGMEPARRHHVVGIEDSGAGIASIVLAGFSAFGIGGGNIVESGTRALCRDFAEDFETLLSQIDGK
jgi:beta-phosphoglucomutase